jgi:hypothetical protein
MNDRVRRLRERLFQADDRAIYLERRAGLVRALRKHADATPELRHALTFAEILDGMTAVVTPDDLLVGRTLDVVPTEADAALLDLPREVLRPPHFNTNGHLTPDWQTLLEKGMAGIRAVAEAGLAGLGGTDDEESARKRRFWQAAVTCCDAVCRLAARYADACEALAHEAAPERAAEPSSARFRRDRLGPSTRPSNRSGSWTS